MFTFILIVFTFLNIQNGIYLNLSKKFTIYKKKIERFKIQYKTNIVKRIILALNCHFLTPQKNIKKFYEQKIQ